MPCLSPWADGWTFPTLIAMCIHHSTQHHIRSVSYYPIYICMHGMHVWMCKQCIDKTLDKILKCLTIITTATSWQAIDMNGPHACIIEYPWGMNECLSIYIYLSMIHPSIYLSIYPCIYLYRKPYLIPAGVWCFLPLDDAWPITHRIKHMHQHIWMIWVIATPYEADGIAMNRQIRILMVSHCTRILTVSRSNLLSNPLMT
jgi:hypothetical protein